MILRTIKSNSAGNGYLLANSQEGLILEAGVHFREVKEALNFRTEILKGCLLTHEHGDHSAYVKEYVSHGVKVHTSLGTASELFPHPFLFTHRALESFRIGRFTIKPFDVKHDAAEPFGYLINHPESGTILFATDTYYIPYKFPGLNHIITEVNYDTDILDRNVLSGRVPQVVRKRVTSSHMEINTFIDFLKANDLKDVHNIVITHLSDSNAHEDQFINRISSFTGLPVYAAYPGQEIELRLNHF